MLANKSSLTIIGTMGLCAVTGTILALGIKKRNWQYISTFASVGCILGAQYLHHDKPLLLRLLKRR